jgi:hypothetical protein
MVVPELSVVEQTREVSAVSVSFVGGGKRLVPKTAARLSRLRKAGARAIIYLSMDVLHRPHVLSRELKVS